MADASGPRPGDLIDRLAQAPWEFDFFRVVRLLEARLDGAPVGYSRRAADDPVRWNHQPVMGFAPATVAGFDPGNDQRPARLETCFLGLIGADAPLPTHLLRLAIEQRQAKGDRALLGPFFDLFHHRMHALFYRAWADCQMTASFQRGSLAEARGSRPLHPPLDWEIDDGSTDHFAVYLASLIGMGMPSFLDRDSVPDSHKFFFAGRLAAPMRNAEGLEAILADFFGVTRVHVLQFVPRWIDLPASEQCALGEGANAELGITAMLGDQVLDCQQTFSLILGPMPWETYQRLLPGDGAAADGQSWRRMVDWIRLYAGEQLNWDARLILSGSEVPRPALDGSGRLGLSIWLEGRDPTIDADDLVVDAPR